MDYGKQSYVAILELTERVKSLELELKAVKTRVTALEEQ